MNPIQHVPGLYGKVPILGDFVSRRLPSHFVRPWDDWLQAALSESREHLGSAWLDVYLISPIWRFLLSPGNCGKGAWAGILMPSVDKVNRYFPLTLAVPVQEPELLPWLFTARTDWFDSLERLALTVLEDDLDLEAFDRALQEMTLMPFLPGQDRYAGAQRIGGKEGPVAFQIGMGGMPKIRDAFVHLSACLLGESLPGYSLWCTNGSEWVTPSLVAYAGLPPAAAYAGLLTGRWQPGEWRGWVTSPSSVLKSGYEAAPPARRSAAAAPLHWRSNAATTVGCVRKVNEDSFVERPEIGLWAVADGVGGHVGGAVASKAVVDALGTIPATDRLEALIEGVTACLQEVNEDLREKAADYGVGKTMGSTVVILLAAVDRCAAVWVGDSRLYRYREGAMVQLTTDHSLVAEWARMGADSQDGLAVGSMANVLTRALGAAPHLEVDTITFEPWEKDIYLLCSDGMIREVTDSEIADVLEKSDLEDASRKLIDLALERGARDNVTAIVVSAASANSNFPGA